MFDVTLPAHGLHPIDRPLDRGVVVEPKVSAGKNISSESVEPSLYGKSEEWTWADRLRPGRRGPTPGRDPAVGVRGRRGIHAGPA